MPVYPGKVCNYLTKPRCKNKSKYGGICQPHQRLIERLRKYPIGVERDSAKMRMILREAKKLHREDLWKHDFEFYFNQARDKLGLF